VPALVVGLALAGTALPASARTSGASTASVTAPVGWVRHVAQPWIWWAPSSTWVAASGPNDLNISSGTGILWNKYGASAAVSVAPVTWFRYLRNNYLVGSRNGPGFWSRALATTAITGVAAVQTIPSQYGYYRQRITFTGTRVGGGTIDGEMIMDYFYVDAFHDAGQRMQVRSAPRTNNASSILLLRKVQSLIFYCGSVC
jgi:hypothetical protein